MDIYKAIIDLQDKGNTGVLITVVNKKGHGPQIPGAKLLLCENGSRIGTIGGGTLEHVAIDEASSLMLNKKSVLKNYILGENDDIVDGIETGMICGGNITLFYEYLGAKDSVLIFGAGHVGKALEYYLKPLNYSITIIDTREEVLNEITHSHKILLTDYNKSSLQNIPLNNSFIVITTHSHELDYSVLKNIFESECNPIYVGMIASKKKTEKMLNRLHSDLHSDIDLSKLYTPIGLKLGGSSPDEIALSIASEIQVIKYSQEGNKHASKKH